MMQHDKRAHAEPSLSSGGADSYATALLPAVFQQTSPPARIASGFSQMKLGEILVSLGVIDSRERDFALERQLDLDLLFGECCLRLRLIRSADLSRALARQFGAVSSLVESPRFGKDLVSVKEPNGAYTEALRALAQRLLSTVLAVNRRVLAISSVESGEGRSHVASNLGVCLARAGYRTLLVDADLRAPKQHSNFGIEQYPGLSRLLCGFAPEDVVRDIPYVENLSLITAGPVPPNPSELLGRKHLRVLIDQARSHYDTVLVDTPAGAHFPDAQLIAAAADGALMVVRKNRTREQEVKDFAERLSASGVTLTGTLMTDH